MRFIILIISFFIFSACTTSKYTQDTEVRAKEIHNEVLTLDTHVDIDTDYFSKDKNLGAKTKNQVDLPKMREGGLDAAFFIVYTAQYLRNKEGYLQAYERANEMFAAIHRMTDELNQNEIMLIEKYSDIEKAKQQNKLMAFIGVENAFPLGTDSKLKRVDEFYKLGARYISLTHNGHSQFADSNTKKLDTKESLYNGVSKLGVKLIKKLNRLGIMIDVSHASKKSMLDAIKYSKAPVIASHSAARALYDHSRNIDDEQLLALKRNGGVIQVVAFQSYLKEPPKAKVEAIKKLDKEFNLPDNSRKYMVLKMRPKEVREKYWDEREKISKKHPGAFVTDLVDHIDHVVKVAGIDHVGISSDFGGGGGIMGWNDASETFNVTKELVHRGYSKEDIRKIWGGNLLRVFKEVEDYAKKLKK